VIAETLERTTLKNLAPGQIVNIERSAKIGDEIGGHILSGHIFATAEITQITPLGEEQKILTFKAPKILGKYLFPKGYIALNGVSLTLVETDIEGGFTVHLIPETLRATTFGQSHVGDLVNVEIDSQTQAIVHTVENFLRMNK
jgi:riboflavin synthase